MGLVGLPFVALACVLMIAMVALSAQVGATLPESPCQELANRLGRGVAIFIGVVLFIIASFFQSSNNLSMLGGFESLDLSFSHSAFDLGLSVVVLVTFNATLIWILYKMRGLYAKVESVMKLGRGDGTGFCNQLLLRS